MKCVLCNQQKGKRGCKVNSNQQICPLCCGKKRSDECTGCGYYQANSMGRQQRRMLDKKFITEINPELDDRCDEALAFADKGETSRARRIFEKLREQHPNYHTVQFGLGVCCVMQGQMEEAISHFKRATEIFPIFTEAYYNLGSAYAKRGQVGEAVQAYEAAIEIAGETGPTGRRARQNLNQLEEIVRKQGMTLSTYVRNQRTFEKAFLALQEKRFQEAIDLFDQVLKVEKNHVQSHSNMGLAYAGLGNRQKALEYLDKAIELDPEYEPAIVNRVGISQMKDGEVLPEIGGGVIHYYRDFKADGKSYLQHVIDKFRAEKECR